MKINLDIRDIRGTMVVTVEVGTSPLFIDNGYFIPYIMGVRWCTSYIKGVTP